MATYALYTASYGSSYANMQVKIFDAVTQAPAIVMATATSGVLSNIGLATLDGSGNLSAYLDSSKTWQVDLPPIPGSNASSSNTQESTQLLVKTAVQTIATNTAGGGGGATAANQTTEITALQSIDTKTPAKGAATSANASPVVIASDQAAIPVTVSGVATAANQTTGNTSLSNIVTNTTGLATATRQDTGNTSLSTIATNTTGVATAAKQDTGNTSLATIAANIPAKGQATSANSQPVVIASDQSAIPVTGSVSTTPVTDSKATGNITVINSNGNTGVGTAGSYVAVTGLNGAATVMVQVSGTWTGTLGIQANLDGTNWITLGAAAISSASLGAIGTNIASGGTGLWATSVPSCAQVRVQAAAAMTGTAVVTIEISPAASGIGLNQGVNLTQVGGGSTASVANSNGSSSRLLGVQLGGGSNANDYVTVAWAAASGNGATISDADGMGGVCSFDINLSTFVAGSSTGLDIFLQWSPDAGTTWYDLWQCEALTAAGHVFIPPIYIPGRRRMRWVNRGGAATTATVTVIANRFSHVPASVQRQWFDRTAGVLAGTASTATAWYDVAGCRNVSAWVPVGTASGPAQYQLQFSSDQVNILPAGAASAAVQNTSTGYAATLGMTARFVRLAVTTAATSQTASTAPIIITGC